MSSSFLRVSCQAEPDVLTSDSSHLIGNLLSKSPIESITPPPNLLPGDICYSLLKELIESRKILTAWIHRSLDSGSKNSMSYFLGSLDPWILGFSIRFKEVHCLNFLDPWILGFKEIEKKYTVLFA